MVCFLNVALTLQIDQLLHSQHHMARVPRKLPWRLRCTKAVSSSRVAKAVFNPLISASRRALRSAYFSGLAMHLALILPLYSLTADNSVLAASRSAEYSAAVLACDLTSALLYLTLCSFVVLVTAFSCVIFSYSDCASDSSDSSLAKLVAKSESEESDAQSEYEKITQENA